MDDPWDVESLRTPGQYISCMKINGSPLLPPVLSKECYKKMQYYKLLAKEVEKRISILQPYVGNNQTETIADQELISAPEETGQVDFDTNIGNLKTLNIQPLETELPTSDFFELSSPNIVTTTDNSSKLVIDFSLSINQSGRNVLETFKRLPSAIEYPKRGCTPLKEKQLLTDVETGNQQDKIKTKLLKDIENHRNTIKNDFPVVESIEGQGDLLQSNRLQNIYTTAVNNNYSPVKTTRTHEDTEKNNKSEEIDINRIFNEDLSQTQEDSSFSLEPEVAISCKSFTGSLNNIHTESLKDCDIPNITRQRSYTVLNPSPQLLAHLEVQSITTGVEVKSISMSESLSCLFSQAIKKRRSWDLESAKVKWSSMAQDLKNKNLPGCNTRNSKKQAPKVTTQANYSPPPKAKSVILDKNKGATPSKCGAKSEAVSKKKPSLHHDFPSNTTVTLGPTAARSPSQKRQSRPSSPTPIAPKSPPATSARGGDNPAKMVRELYEKIQRDQMAQMAILVEKQKKEQKQLQQVFEEQNNILFKQLKTIVPEGSIEAKQAWGADSMEPERGPVSLSQLINHNQNDHLTSLTQTHNYISKCDTVLKKSRDISSAIKKPKAVTPNGNKRQSPRAPERSKSNRSPVRNIVSPTRKELARSPTMSPAGRRLIQSPKSLAPAQRSRSRKLNYDTSSDREPDLILTDRTNDTLADLNVTFPTDTKSDTESSRSASPPLNENELTIIPSFSVTLREISETLDSANNGVTPSRHSMRGKVQHSLASNPQAASRPSPKQLAAASKIVAFAKGYLVRRLMRTERVTATVQTIRDALLCALQLHQDREGIRGADVDLHRRLIQQITAACYSLHDTFVASSPAERCALIAADRARLLRPRPVSAHSTTSRRTDVMSQSHCGVFRARRSSSSASLMTQSTHESYSSDKGRRPRYAPSPRRHPWR